jgi:hypothetical protein
MSPKSGSAKMVAAAGRGMSGKEIKKLGLGRPGCNDQPVESIPQLDFRSQEG